MSLDSYRHSVSAFSFLSELEGTRGRRPPLAFKKPGLVVIDLQRLFADPASPAFLPDSLAIHSPIMALISACRKHDHPIIFTRHEHEPDDAGSLVERFFGRLLLRGDPLADLLPEIEEASQEGDVLVKSRHDGFHGGLPTSLGACDALFLVGLQTPLCVLATAIGLARYGIVPVVVADACAARRTDLHRAALRCLASGHAQVCSTTEALAALEAQ